MVLADQQLTFHFSAHVMGRLDLVMQISKHVDASQDAPEWITRSSDGWNLLFGEDREMHKERDRKRTKEGNRKDLSAEIGEEEVCPASDYTGSVLVLLQIRWHVSGVDGWLDVILNTTFSHITRPGRQWRWQQRAFLHHFAWISSRCSTLSAHLSKTSVENWRASLSLFHVCTTKVSGLCQKLWTSFRLRFHFTEETQTGKVGPLFIFPLVCSLSPHSMCDNDCWSF